MTSQNNLGSLKEYISLSDKFKNHLLYCDIYNSELVVSIQTQYIQEFIKFLKENQKCQFQMLIDLCVADYPQNLERFEIIYNLLSLTQNLRIRVKCLANEDTIIPSVTKLFSAAGWFEREAWDMFGVYFSGNDDLRRILTDYGFEGHPMRKDFPLTGYVEVKYDLDKKAVVYEPVQLTQEFRKFDFLSPWEGTDYILPGDEKAKNQ